MTIQPIKNDQAVSAMASDRTAQESMSARRQSAQAQGPPASTPGSVVKEKMLSDAVTVTAPANETAKRLAAIRADISSRSARAAAVRAAHNVEGHLVLITQTIGMIVKNYPPFSRGDAKRQEYLMSIEGIRHQIEEMTQPPPPPSVPVNGVWADLFRGIAPPRLQPNGPYEASDAQVLSAYEEVQAMRSTLAVRSGQLERQVSLLSPMSMAQAEQVSRETGQGLYNLGLSLTSNLAGALLSL